MGIENKFGDSGGSVDRCLNAIPGLRENISNKDPLSCEEAQKIDHDWRQKRTEFFIAKIRFDALKSITDKTEFSKKFQNLSKKHQETVNKINSTLRISHEEDYQGLIQSTADKIHVDERISEMIKAEMRNKLLHTCNDLMAHYNAQQVYVDNQANKYNSQESSSEMYKRALQLPDLVKNDLECLEGMDEHKNEKFDYSAKHLNAETSRRQTMEGHLNILNEIVDIHLTEKVPRSNNVHAEFLSAKAKTLEMKLRSLEEEIRCLTYTKETCAELERTRREILVQTDSVRRQVSQLHGELGSYKAVSGGTDYEELVDIYGQLKVDIEGKLWALKELQSNPTNNPQDSEQCSD